MTEADDVEVNAADADATDADGTGGGGADAGRAATAGDAPQLPRLGVVGTLRFVWRQLTSMRVALMLLMLLAVVAVPGSVLPQRPQDPAAVARYLEDNATLGPWLDRLGFFDVYASVWFSAVYLLLFVSLVGCILPRLRAHLRAVRARPPRAPRRFERFGVHDEVTTDASVDDVVERARVVLVGRVPRLPRFRVDVERQPGGGATVSAERGYLRESGNILFHLALLGILVSVATGQLLHYRGQAIVVEGRGFANAVTAYDTFRAGTAFDPRSLVPFTMTLDRFSAEFTADARPRDFTAEVTLAEPGAEPRAETIKVNHPLSAGAAKVYLQGNGYAPDVVVRDAAGEVAFAGPVPFLPQDAVYTSNGVIKVPDVTTGEQIGLQGVLLPTAVVSPIGAASVHPQPDEPLLVLSVWSGDLGLDEGIPQNVYELDTDAMTQATEDDGTAVTLFVEPGQTVELPDGLGTITWEGLPRFVALDLRHDPALPWILACAIGCLVGLAVSLFTPRRRVWLRITPAAEGAEGRDATDGGEAAAARGADGSGTRRTVVAGAALARGDDVGLADELARVMDQVRGDHPEGQDDESR
ncbi:cytochrome c biogenesis protein ResB [Actinotalea ferrariae]|uniref:cytochrome c biogenesis protein ResB n=1 Tax=Actinotalea ferrariae TaxID=1386098 RepID=UPI0027E00F4F|nr:cytochrome c biogenesis protein ResB [Actinotalea ferrariae]